MRIALTGGIACGKSTIAKFLRELGICVLDADDVVHELEATGGDAVPAIARRFGKDVLAPDGSVDRRRLARIVFSNRRDRSDLEGILFPRVRARLCEFVQPTSPSRGENGKDRFRIAIIPLLFESHWESDYDTIITIVSTAESQISRMIETRGYSRAEAEARLAAQMNVAEKAERSHYVVVNDSTQEKLKEEVGHLVAWLEERAKHEY